MQVCDITGKGKQFGSNVSFSQRHTKKVFKPNLQVKTLIIDGQKVRLNISTQAFRTLRKKGLLNGPVVATAPASTANSGGSTG